MSRPALRDRLAPPRLPRPPRPPARSLTASPPLPHRAAKKAAAAKAEEEAAAKKAAKKAAGGGGGGGGEAGKKRKREEEPSSDAAKASSASSAAAASGSRVLASGRVKKEVAIEAVLAKAQYVDLRWNPLAALEADDGDSIQRSAEYKELPGFRGVFVGVGDVVLGEIKDKRPLEPRPS